MNSQLTFLFFTYFYHNELWPYYQKDTNQFTLNQKTLWNVALCIFEAFIQILLNMNHALDQTFQTALYEANLDDSTDSNNFSVRGYLPLIQKHSITHMHGLAVYV